jgi:hypothetical protein
MHKSIKLSTRFLGISPTRSSTNADSVSGDDRVGGRTTDRASSSASVPHLFQKAQVKGSAADKQGPESGPSLPATLFPAPIAESKPTSLAEVAIANESNAVTFSGHTETAPKQDVDNGQSASASSIPPAPKHRPGVKVAGRLRPHAQPKSATHISYAGSGFVARKSRRLTAQADEPDGQAPVAPSVGASSSSSTRGGHLLEVPSTDAPSLPYRPVGASSFSSTRERHLMEVPSTDAPT